MVNIGSTLDKVTTFNSSGVLRTLVGGHVYKLVQNMEVSLNEINQDEDYIDDAAPMFSRVGDKVGTFNFDLKASVDLFESGATPSTTYLMSYWMAQIVDNNPPEISFVETLNAPKSAGDKFARITFKARIREVTPRRDVSRGLKDISVRGEVIEFNGAVRAAT